LIPLPFSAFSSVTTFPVVVPIAHDRIVSAIEVASGVAPVTIGKPQPLLMEEAAHAVGRDPREAYVIGDGIVTDLAAANAVGAKTILIRSWQSPSRPAPWVSNCTRNSIWFP
jgi:predicted HAD superfamily phosphohydrolase YqeG